MALCVVIVASSSGIKCANTKAVKFIASSGVLKSIQAKGRAAVASSAVGITRCISVGSRFSRDK